MKTEGLCQLSSVGAPLNDGLELARNRVALDSCALTRKDHLQGQKGGHHLALWKQGATNILTVNLQS